jgi:hypothetical protein
MGRAIQPGSVGEWSWHRAWTDGAGAAMKQPAWIVRVVSDLAGLSQVELVFDAACDPPLYAFHGMHDVMFLPPEHAATSPRLPALPPRMQRVGIVGSRSPAERSSHGVDTPRPWTLAFTWPVGTSGDARPASAAAPGAASAHADPPHLPDPHGRSDRCDVRHHHAPLVAIRQWQPAPTGRADQWAGCVGRASRRATRVWCPRLPPAAYRSVNSGR